MKRKTERKAKGTKTPPKKVGGKRPGAGRKPRDPWLGNGEPRINAEKLIELDECDLPSLAEVAPAEDSLRNLAGGVKFVNDSPYFVGRYEDGKAVLSNLYAGLRRVSHVIATTEDQKKFNYAMNACAAISPSVRLNMEAIETLRRICDELIPPTPAEDEEDKLKAKAPWWPGRPLTDEEFEAAANQDEPTAQQPTGPVQQPEKPHDKTTPQAGTPDSTRRERPKRT